MTERFGRWVMLPTSFAEATAVKICECCQFQIPISNAGDMINWQLAAFAHHDLQKPWRRRLATLIEVWPDADFVQ